MRLAYDGTAYQGWQKTPTGPSIEESLQSVLEQVLQHPIRLQAASRTDAGVHARGQVANFQTHKPVDLHKLQISLCCLLPRDIAVLEIAQERPDFHPTLDCIAKEYQYALCTGTVQMPQDRFYEWHYPHFLQVGAMREAIPFFLGEKDYAAFCNAKKNESYAHHRRLITHLSMEEVGYNKLIFTIRGNHFLYKMVRNIVGTLVYVGCGKIAVDQVAHILLKGDRKEAGMTAPAHGLTLVKVFYAP